MIFFWALFDGTVSYISPLLITQNGYSKTGLGFLLGSSSVAGAFFDYLLSKFLKNPHYRVVYLIMFICCFVFPLVLWKATSFFVFILAMALWGLYYNLYNFGVFDFVSRVSPSDERGGYFGMLYLFKSLGYIIAPLLVGFVISTNNVINT